MGRAPCCDKANVKKGPWSPDEDAKLKAFIDQHGTGGNWISLPSKAGLKRCGKSCRLRWINYLRPDIKHGGFTEEEEIMIYKMHANIGSRWSLIAAQLPGRTDNDIKNYWNTRLKKKYNDRNVEQLSLPNFPRLSPPPRDKFSHGSPPRDRFANERDDDPVMTTISSCELTPSSELTVLRDPSDGLVPRFGKAQQYASPHLRDPTTLPDVVVATPSVQSQPMTSIQHQQIHQQIQQQQHQVQQQLQQQQQVQQHIQQQQQVQQHIQQQQQVQQHIQQQQQVQHQQQIRIVKSEFSDLQATGGVGEVREKLLSIENRLPYCIPSHPSSTSSSSCSGMSIDRSSYAQSCNGMNAENSTYVPAAQGVENTYSDCLSTVMYRDDQLNEVEESSALLPVMSSAVSPSSFGIPSSVQSQMAHACEDSTALVTGMSASAVAPAFGIRNSGVAPSQFGIQISSEPELQFSGMGVQEFFDDSSKIITGGVKTEANWYDYMTPPKHTAVSFTSVAAAPKQYQHHQHQYQMQQHFVHPDSWVSQEPSPSSFMKATWINVASSCNGNLSLSGPIADHIGFRYEQKPISWDS